MKIYIITVQKAPNFGAYLQAYALFQYLQSKGYSCKLIDLLRPIHKEFKRTKGFEPYCKIPYKIKYRDLLRRKYYSLLKFVGYRKKRFKEIDTKNKRFNDFDDLISYTSKYNSIAELYKNPPVGDYYITGSDQLWNPTQNYCLEPYFLTFVKEGRKISYATSIGITDLSDHVKKDFSQWLKSYDYISVRERDAVNLISPLVSQPVYQVCDPTFLISSSKWEQLSIKVKEYGDYIFVFTLAPMPEVVDFALSIQKQLGYKVIVFGHSIKEPESELYEMVYSLGPREWLGMIRNAKIVITNSFHGTVFSLLFQTPFLTYIAPGSKRGSRIVNLLNIFGLSERLLRSLENKECINNTELLSLDCKHIDEVIENERKKGFDFLNMALS